jgi:hypothetical protein
MCRLVVLNTAKRFNTVAKGRPEESKGAPWTTSGVATPGYLAKRFRRPSQPRRQPIGKPEAEIVPAQLSSHTKLWSLDL